MGALACLAGFALGAGCASPTPPVAWSVRFDSEPRALAAAFVEARIRRDACGTGEIVREYGRIGRDAVVAMPGAVLAPGRYCFEAEAIDRGCVRYAAATLATEVPRATPVELELAPIAATRECAQLICSDGTCDFERDAGVDGGIDIGFVLPDANVDAHFVPPDAGPPPPTAARGCGEATLVGLEGTVRAGRAHTCALAGPFGGGRTLHCWGADDHGQLGVGGRGESRVPVRVPGTFTTVAAGGDHTCATDAEGTLFCWGRNDHGQLGLGDREDRDTPTRVMSSVSSVSAGELHTCALRSRMVGMMTVAEAVCWGANEHGQLGILGEDRDTPTATLTSEMQVTAIVAGATHTCASTLDTSFATQLWCWGEVGPWLGRATPTAGPAPIDEPPAFSSTLTAGRHVTCDATFDPGRGTTVVRCWGEGAMGRLLDGTGTDSFVPRIVPGSTPAPGGALTCLVQPTADGTASVACAGDPALGVRGPMPAAGLAPTPVLPGGSGVIAGDRHACALGLGGLVCWGANDRGQLGTGGAGAIEATPTRVCF